MKIDQTTILDLLSLDTYKDNPKKLYKQLVRLSKSQDTVKALSRVEDLLIEFKKVRSPDEYPEIWI